MRKLPGVHAGSHPVQNTRVATLRQVLIPGACLAAIGIALHILCNVISQHAGYGIFRDEMYYLVCGRRLAFGYVDQPPLVALQARLTEFLFGYDHMWSLRLLAALAGGAKIVLTGLLARALGATRTAAMLAMLAVLTVPVYLSLDSFLSMNAFDPVFWMTAMLAILSLTAENLTARARCGWWLLFGASAGLGLENKASETFFLIALLAALLVTPARRLLASRWCAAAVTLLLMLALPNLLWQADYHFPTWEWLRDMQHSDEEVKLSLLQMLGGQLLMLGPLQNLLWISGVLWLLLSGQARRWRFAGALYLFFLALMLALGAKDYYLAPVYPVYFAAGAVAWTSFIEGWSMRARQRASVAMWSYAALLVLCAGVALPFAIPILPPAAFRAYERRLHFVPKDEEVHTATLLPQFFADRFGWDELLTKTAAIYKALPPEERARTGILVKNYGEASAINLYGLRYGLPVAISGHQNYWLWGPDGYTGDEMILVTQASPSELAPYYRSCILEATRLSPLALPWERGPIYLCRGRKAAYLADWPSMKEYR